MKTCVSSLAVLCAIELMSPYPSALATAKNDTRAIRHPTTILRIIDGDTLIANLNNTPTRTCSPACASWRRVRLANIDAPELTQPHGPSSRAHLVSLITNRTITIHSHGRDRYGRTLATLFAGDININLAMVRAGYAWRYRYARKTGPIAEAEAQARAEGRGIWATDGAVAPWEFRKRGGALSAETKRREFSSLRAFLLRMPITGLRQLEPQVTNISALLPARRSLARRLGLGATISLLDLVSLAEPKI